MDIINDIKEGLNWVSGIFTVIAFFGGGFSGYKLKSVMIRKDKQTNIFKGFFNSGNNVKQSNEKKD